MEAFQKCTNPDPSSPEGQVLIGQHFITQSAPDTREKLQKLQMGPQTALAQLMDVAFSVFTNQDLEERQAKLLALALSGNIGRGQSPHRNPGKPQRCGEHKDQICLRCKCPGHWAKECTKQPPGPRPKCKGTNLDPWHWKVDCPHSQSGKGSTPMAMAALED